MTNDFDENEFYRQDENEKKETADPAENEIFSSSEKPIEETVKEPSYNPDGYTNIYSDEIENISSSSEPLNADQNFSQNKENSHNPAPYYGYKEKQENQYFPNTNYNYFPYPQQGFPQNGGMPPKKGKNKGLKVFITIVAVCFFFALGGIVYSYNQDSPAKNGQKNTKETKQSETTSNVSVDLTDEVMNEKSATARIASKVTPSVVSVTVYSNSYFEGTSSGSGFIITEDGYIVTNHHVVSMAAGRNGSGSEIKVSLENGKIYKATYIASDSKKDIAVIKIDEKNLPKVQIGNSDQLVPGEFVLAIGNPLGEVLNGSVSFGVVSGIGRVDVSDNAIPYIQTDAAINPGNSGGPLINMSGEVVGINTAKIAATGYEGLGFSIPISVAMPIIDQLIKNEASPEYAYIGINFLQIGSEEAKEYNVPVGLMIKEIYKESKIDRNAVELGDVIVKADGKKITTSSDLLTIIENKKPGDKITLTLYRPNFGNGQTYDTTVELISIPQESE